MDMSVKIRPDSRTSVWVMLARKARWVWVNIASRPKTIKVMRATATMSSMRVKAMERASVGAWSVARFERRIVCGDLRTLFHSRPPFHKQVVGARAISDSDAKFPLTPALSLGEREISSAVVGEWDRFMVTKRVIADIEALHESSL